MSSFSVTARYPKSSHPPAVGLTSAYNKDGVTNNLSNGLRVVKDKSDLDSDSDVQLPMPEPGQASFKMHSSKHATTDTDTDGLPLSLRGVPQARLVLLTSEEAKKLKKSLATTNPTATVHVIGVDRSTSLVIFSRNLGDWNAMASIALLRILYERRSPRLSFVDKARDVACSLQGNICLVGACFVAAALGTSMGSILPLVISWHGQSIEAVQQVLNVFLIACISLLRGMIAVLQNALDLSGQL